MPTTATESGYEWITLHTACVDYQVGYSTLRGWIASGKLPAFRLADGNRLRLRRSDIEALLQPVIPREAT
jgi:excisionase family DNA binding protein